MRETNGGNEFFIYLIKMFDPFEILCGQYTEVEWN